jgi:kumamolisin
VNLRVLAAGAAAVVPTTVLPPAMAAHALTTHAPVSQLSGPSWWSGFLAHSTDLGPASQVRLGVLVNLRASARGTAVAKRAVSQWAVLHALAARFYADGAVALLAGPAPQLGAAFGARVDDWRSPAGTFFAAAKAQPVVPTELRPYVSGIGRLSSYSDWQLDDVGGDGLSPAELLEVYDARSLSQELGGAGETVVAFEVDGYSKQDLDSFSSRYRLPKFFSGPGRLVVSGGSAGKVQGETDMDLETLREVAPRAKLVYFNLAGVKAESTAGALVSAFSEAAKDWPGAIWALSLGLCEKLFSFNDLVAINKVVASAEAAGTSVFAASGDTAGLDCTGWDSRSWGSVPNQNDVGVQVPAVLPTVTGVGGTTLTLSPTGTYLSEAAWYYPALGQGTGGGISSMIARPSWQVGPGLPQPTPSSGREVPDVAALADPVTGNAIIEGGSLAEGNGTSLATPVWAGFMALIDAYLRSVGDRPVGFANADLYYLASHSPPYRPFHLISSGGNALYYNGAGYNPTTGLGSPDVWQLARDFAWLARGQR